MKFIRLSRFSISWVGLEGALMALSPLMLIFAFIGIDSTPPLWRLGIASFASVACFVCALTLFRRPVVGKLFGGISASGSYMAALPYILNNPFAALLETVILIRIGFALLDFRPNINSNKKNNHIERCLQRALWATLTVPIVVIINKVLNITNPFYTVSIIVLSLVIAQVLFIHWAYEQKSRRLLLLPAAGIFYFTFILYSSDIQHVPSVALLISLMAFILLPNTGQIIERREPWWEILMNHPARILLSTFLILCFSGTLLLIIPALTKTGTIDLVDAAFTSVSAVCVTGLIVLDTPNNFTLIGQFFILLLIQLGGLGIMSITIVALHTIGHRLSLKQEHLLTSMSDTYHKDLITSLAMILKFTLIAEGIGALFLSVSFYSAGDSLIYALWRGVFTAISAFCNAGFSLQTDNLIQYQNNPFILHTVATLIVFGGMAPATSLIVPLWLRGKQIPIPARIALITTVVLLFSGMFFILAFEWNGILAGLSIFDKIQNAWFQSVTLRTAGFNSVDIAKVTNPTFLIMICLMFIGGSPGGTAGGVKTTTIGILAMTFWANITNRNDVIIQNRRIRSGTIYRAITIVTSVMIVWLLVVLMLEITQQISARNIIFEATSAIGTVGLSTGATAMLDEIGKIIIMVAMFAGRIGPITLFMFLSDDQTASVSRCPDTKISLT